MPPLVDCLAIDIGGTKLAVALVDERGAIRGQLIRPTPRTEDPELLFDALTEMIDSLRRAPGAQPALVGVGCGGPMELGGRRVSPLNIPAWRNFPLHERLEAATGLAVVIDNDAKALALGEGCAALRLAERITSPWWSQPGLEVAWSSMVGSLMAGWAMRATSATWWSSPEVDAVVAGCAAASRRRHRDRRSKP